jgi:hypothetical protein
VSLWTAAAAAAALLAVGYALGRLRPARRASDWANWKKCDQSMRRHSFRWWAVFVVLSVENLTWLAAHPVQGWDAWKHRNDPPPPRGPAPTFDPDWAAKRRAAAQEDA